MILAKAAGWVGSVSYVVAYLLLSLNKIRSDKTMYHALNVVGAIGLIIDAFYLKDYPNLAVNVVWSSIAFFAIYRIGKKKSL